MTQKYPIITGGNWSGSIWNTSPGQVTSNTTTPTSSDAVTFTATEVGLVTCDTAVCSCNTLTFSTLSNGIAVGAGNDLQVSGNLVLVNGMTLTAGSASSMITIYMPTGGTTSVTPDSKTWGGYFRVYNNSTTNQTVTFGPSFTVGKLITQNSSTGLAVLNSNTLTCTNGLRPYADSSGTTILSITGGHLEASDVPATHRIDNPITFTSGTITIDDGFSVGGATARNWNYVGGTVSVPAGATLNVCGGINWNTTYAQVPIVNINMRANGTFTLGQNSQISGALTGTGSLTLNGVFTLTCHDILTFGSITAGNVGTKIIITGGTAGAHSVWSRSGSAVHQCTVQLGILNNGDYIDIADTVSWGNTSDVLTSVADAHITCTGTFTIFPSIATLNIPTVTFTNLNVGGSSGSAIALVTDLNVTGSLTQSTGTNVSFTGSHDVYCGTFNASQTTGSATSLVLYAGRTFYISTGINIYGAYSNAPTRFLIKSSAGGSKTNIAYSGAASACNIGYAAFTDIAATANTLFIYNAGTIATSTNIVNVTGASFINIIGLVD